MKIIDKLKRHVSLALAVAALGCGGGDGGGSEPGGGGTGNSGGSNDGGGNTNGTGSCRTASDLEEVLAPVELPFGAVVRYLASDGEYVYFSGLQTLNRVPASGGTYETLWDGGSGTLYVPFFLRESDLVVVQGREVFSLPKAGGEPTPLATLPATPYGSIDGRLDFLLDGDTAYFKTETGIGDDPVILNLYRVDLETGESTLVTSLDGGKGSRLARSGDALYVRTADPDEPEPTDEFQPRPSALYRVFTSEGEFERVAVSFPGTRKFSFAPIGGDDESVFLAALALPDGDDDFGASEQSGIYRVPRDGGEATQLVSSLQILNLQAEHVASGDRSFFRVSDVADTIYSYEGGTLEEVICVSDLVYSIAVDAAHVYLGISPSDEDVSTIVRHPL